MDIQNVLWKLHALGDSSILEKETRDAVKLAADVLNTVRNIAEMGAGEDLVAICVEVNKLVDAAAASEEKDQTIYELKHSNARRPAA
jgi:hypothetical protein